MPMRPIVRHPESAQQQFSVTYTWVNAEGARKTGYWSGLFSGADMALRNFHSFVQRNSESNADRKVVRPKLGHRDYRITEFARVYRGEVGEQRGQEIRQEIEMPAGEYPNLRREKGPPPPPTMEFGFVADMPKGRPAESPVFIEDQS